MDSRLKSRIRDNSLYFFIGLGIVISKIVYDSSLNYFDSPRFEYLEMDMNGDGFNDKVTISGNTIISRLYDPETNEFEFSKSYSVFDNKLD